MRAAAGGQRCAEAGSAASANVPAAALAKAGKPVQLIAAKGHNHFEMGESLSNPYGIMGRAAMEMMKLTTAV